MRLEPYRAGAEAPLRAKLRIMGIPEPEYMQDTRETGSWARSWQWLPFHKLRYATRRLVWREHNVAVERLLREKAEV